ncbi:MAG TPA: hypothetical protein VFO01_14650 [Trebonia sp.]|nr:hypothetical protein [Trebonia sp.]
MFNRRPEEFRQVHRTIACLRDVHAECPHMLSTGGGFNPSWLRPEFGVGLCSCDCHAPCPVSREKRLVSGLGLVTGWATVPARTWLESCTCPGAEAERLRLDQAGYEFPDFDEVAEQARQRHQPRREAFDAARAQAAGKSREQVKELYLAELRARGQETEMPQEALDATVAAIAGDHLTVARLMGRLVVDSVKIFRAAHRHYELPVRGLAPAPRFPGSGSARSPPSGSPRRKRLCAQARSQAS